METAYSEREREYSISISYNDVRSQTRLAHLHHLLLLGLHPVAQGLDLSEQQHHQSQMLVDPFLEGSLVSESQSNVSGLLV